MNEKEKERNSMVESMHLDVAAMDVWGARLQTNLEPRIDEVLNLMVISVAAHREADDLTRRMVGPLVDAIYAADGEEGMFSQELEDSLIGVVNELSLRECGGDELREACRDYLMETLVGFSNITQPTHTWG